uniref:Uncharacterized protein n=1 Tax=Taeniopygia guttata TaxID=59729 RepID=A0A674HHW5_TAEGU
PKTRGARRTHCTNYPCHTLSARRWNQYHHFHSLDNSPANLGVGKQATVPLPLWFFRVGARKRNFLCLRDQSKA